MSNKPKDNDIDYEELKKAPQEAPADKIASVAAALLKMPPEEHKDIPKKRKKS